MGKVKWNKYMVELKRLNNVLFNLNINWMQRKVHWILSIKIHIFQSLQQQTKKEIQHIRTWITAVSFF